MKLSLRLFSLFIFFSSTHINAVSTHGGNAPSGSGSAASDIYKMPDIAKIAQERGEQSFCSPHSAPPDNVKCAHQVSLLLQEAGVEVNNDGVLNLVEILEKRGWTKCDEPVPGAIAASNPGIPGTDDRSHIGAVGLDSTGRKMCITHNSGGEGGCMVRTGVDGNPCDSQGDAGSAPFNQNWAQNVAYYAPSCTPPLMSHHPTLQYFKNAQTLFKNIGLKFLNFFSLNKAYAKLAKKLFVEEEKITLLKELNIDNQKWKIERKDILLNNKIDSSWYILSGFNEKNKQWQKLGADQSLWRFVENDPWKISGENARIFKTPSLKAKHSIFLVQLEDSVPQSLRAKYKTELEKRELAGNINLEQKWILNNFLRP